MKSEPPEPQGPRTPHRAGARQRAPAAELAGPPLFPERRSALSRQRRDLAQRAAAEAEFRRLIDDYRCPPGEAA